MLIPSQMTGTYNYHAGDVPIAYSLFDGRKCEAPDCLPCGKPHVYDFAKPNNMLYHEEVSAKMCKPTHVRATKVYEVSIKMLRLERSQRSVSGWTLDSRSISEVLRMSATERDRLARRAYPVRNWPVAHTIDSNQPSPPYPGSDFNHNAGTYTGLLVESKVVKGGLESVSGDGDLTLRNSTEPATLNPTDLAATATVPRTQLPQACPLQLLPPRTWSIRLLSHRSSSLQLPSPLRRRELVQRTMSRAPR